jgi:Holliday junction resolvasome RuvABC ATP-dependent DNA helicase subunit
MSTEDQRILAVLRANTRNGHIGWQNVAQQLNMTRDRVKALYEGWVKKP